MAEQLDRIRVWNIKSNEMMEPATIQEMLSMERNAAYQEEELAPEDYWHLVFMRNTGIYAQPSDEVVNTTREEIFEDDIVTHSTEPYVYRVAQKNGCWWAMTLSPHNVEARLLNKIFNPKIVGNVFENRELVLRGGDLK